MVKNADGQRGDRSARTPGAGAARLQQAGPAADIQAERRRLRVRFEMEAAVLHEGWQRLLPAAGPVGCDAQDLARLSRPAEHGLVGEVLPGRQYAAADRAALRRLPLSQLQRADENRERVERR